MTPSNHFRRSQSSRSIVAISDFHEGWPPHFQSRSVAEAREDWIAGRRGPAPRLPPDRDEQKSRLEVRGGYLERLPLAAVKHGLVDRAEIWHFSRSSETPFYREDHPLLVRRAFRSNNEEAPFRSADMLGFIEAFGAPDILCVWGLGVEAAVLEACAASFKIYNSIDAPALRMPDEVARHFDLMLTGAEWQSREIEGRLAGMQTAIMPIGPEFADPLTFHPVVQTEKLYDVVYVAAAQDYKRHDILFDALQKRPGTRALCVFGYGEQSEHLRDEAVRRGLDVSFVGPPGVPFAEVNALMNQARIGVVCGVNDGAPAILTEYMLAGLPVLANSALSCGLQFILPETGLAVPGERFHEGIGELLSRAPTMDPRAEVLKRWTWDHTITRLASLMRDGTGQGPHTARLETVSEG